MTLELVQQVAAALPDRMPKTLGVAVSGGGDSIALLSLLHRVSGTTGLGLSCVTVDHGLRPEAASEAKTVAELCSKMSISHETLAWRDWDGKGNLQNEARKGRYALIADWARRHDIRAIALGHTQDDQAETVVMRLARGAGVDGLSAMSPMRRHKGLTWVRPLLGISRLDLRRYLEQEYLAWHEDPSNEDDRFDRIKVRKALEIIAPLGVDRAALAQVAANMQSARCALDDQTRAVAVETAQVRAGAVTFNWNSLAALPSEIMRRLIVASIKWIASSEYAPRSRAVRSAMETLGDGAPATLGGCQMKRIGESLWIFRELQAVRDKVAIQGELWDARWQVTGPNTKGLHVAALGQTGLSECPGWRETGVPRDVLLATPALWNGSVLCAAPLAGEQNGWHASLKKSEASIFDAVISH